MKAELLSGSPRSSFIAINFIWVYPPCFLQHNKTRPASNSSDWVRKDQNTPRPFTCPATFESGQAPALGGELSPDFLLASVMQDPHHYLMVVTLSTSTEEWGLSSFLVLSAICRCMGLFVHFKGCAISVTGKISKNSLSSETLSFFRRLASARQGPEQLDQALRLALLWVRFWATNIQSCLANDIPLTLWTSAGSEEWAQHFRQTSRQG